MISLKISKIFKNVFKNSSELIPESTSDFKESS